MLINGVAKACKEHNVAILTYASLGYGFLTWHVKKLEDIPEGDFRHLFGRFQPENFDQNLELVNTLRLLTSAVPPRPNWLWHVFGPIPIQGAAVLSSLFLEAQRRLVWKKMSGDPDIT